jgi:DNA-binding NarL/FixJ family response regulator
MSDDLRIVIADDHEIFRIGLRQVISDAEGMTVVGEAVNGYGALGQVRSLKPHVLLLDVQMEVMDGFDTARAVRAERLPVQIVILTQDKSERSFNEAMDIGVRGYLIKDTAYVEVLKAIRLVASGKHYVSAELSSFLVNRSERAGLRAPSQESINSLSPTDRRILKLLVKFKSNEEIAAELHLSHHTIQHRREDMCRRFHLSGHHALLKFAIEHQSEL